MTWSLLTSTLIPVNLCTLSKFALAKRSRHATLERQIPKKKFLETALKEYRNYVTNRYIDSNRRNLHQEVPLLVG